MTRESPLMDDSTVRRLVEEEGDENQQLDPDLTSRCKMGVQAHFRKKTKKPLFSGGIFLSTF